MAKIQHFRVQSLSMGMGQAAAACCCFLAYNLKVFSPQDVPIAELKKYWQSWWNYTSKT